MGTTELKVEIDDSSIMLLIGYVQNLQTSNFQNARRVHFESTRNQDRLHLAIREFVTRFIYDVYEPKGYDRTYNLLDSFTSLAGDDKENASPSLTVLTDPDIAPAKTGKNQGVLSYAMFFERPRKLKTFLSPKGSASKFENWRPFVAEFTRLAKAMMREMAEEATHNALHDLMPRELR